MVPSLAALLFPSRKVLFLRTTTLELASTGPWTLPAGPMSWLLQVMIEVLEPAVALHLLSHTHPIAPALAATHPLRPLVALLEAAILPAPATHQQAVAAIR
jgi:hypothetical protein